MTTRSLLLLVLLSILHCAAETGDLGTISKSEVTANFANVRIKLLFFGQIILQPIRRDDRQCIISLTE